MLPKEVGTLFNAVASAEPTAIDAQRLKAELAGIAAFHRELHTNNLLTLDKATCMRSISARTLGTQR